MSRGETEEVIATMNQNRLTHTIRHREDRARGDLLLSAVMDFDALESLAEVRFRAEVWLEADLRTRHRGKHRRS